MNITRLLTIASEWKPLVAIRTGYATLLPLILLQGISIAAATALGLAFGDGEVNRLRDLLNYTHTFVLSLLPALSVIAIAYHAANMYGSNRPFAVVLSLFVYLVLVMTYNKNADYQINEVTLLGSFYSLIVGPAVPWALGRLERVAMLQLFRSPQQNAYIRRFLNYVLPTLIIVGVAIATSGVSQVVSSSGVFSAWHSGPDWADHFSGLALYTVALNAVWTVGIHGTVALEPWVGDLRENWEENVAAELMGQSAPNIFPGPAFHAFVHLGGSGTALALALAIFLVARSRTKRLICLSAMPVLCFNVNELLIFGLPVIFNRYLMLPFVLAPLACMTVAYTSIVYGLVPVPTESPGWATPPLVGAWLATRGSWTAVALASFNLAMAAAIYIPFVRRWESSQRALSHSVLEFKDRFRFDSNRSETYIDQDSLADSQDERDQLRDALSLLREGELCSYYQPIVRVSDGRIVGVESLLRLIHPSRGVLPPLFLDTLKRARLSYEIDNWVVKNIVSEWREWDTDSHAAPEIHINMTPESLLNVHLVERIIEAGRLLPLNVEVIEDELPGDLGEFLTFTSLLQRNGIRVAIDDFGVGHSSLSRLAMLGISELKIDKSMLDSAFSQPRGKQLLAAVVDLAKKLEMKVCVEGVERVEQLVFLKACGVDHVQGYLLGRPMPWGKMRDLIRSDRPLPGFE